MKVTLNTSVEKEDQPEQPQRSDAEHHKPGVLETAKTLVPGLVMCAVAVGLAVGIAQFVPVMSALLVAILLGVIVRNTIRLPHALEPGLHFASKRLLRTGVVLLGLQVALGDILKLGPGVILLVVAVVGLGICVALLLGKALKISDTLTLLIGCGFSICGAAAVAALDGVMGTRKRESETVISVALVVLFGTLMIPIVPLLGGLMGLSNNQIGIWGGASVHEVAQVVAIGGAIGGSALSVAVVVKLARVLLLAPIMATVSIAQRRKAEHDGGKLPPIMPLFVAGFIAAVAIRSIFPLPAGFLHGAQLVETILLAAAMFALGTGVKLSMFKHVGVKPFVLGALVTLFVGCLGLGGAVLFG